MPGAQRVAASGELSNDCLEGLLSQTFQQRNWNTSEGGSVFPLVLRVESAEFLGVFGRSIWFPLSTTRNGGSDVEIYEVEDETAKEQQYFSEKRRQFVYLLCGFVDALAHSPLCVDDEFTLIQSLKANRPFAEDPAMQNMRKELARSISQALLVVVLGHSGFVGWLLDDLLLLVSGVIFLRAKMEKETRKLKTADTSRLFSLWGDGVATVFGEALRSVLAFFHAIPAGEHHKWQTSESSFVNARVKRECENKGGDQVVTTAKTVEETQSQISILLKLRVTDLINRLVNRLTAWPSPLLDGRFSLLGFWASHSRKRWTEPHSQFELKQLRKTVSVCRGVIGDVPLSWLSLMHVVAAVEPQVFDAFDNQLPVPLRPPLTCEAPGDLMFVFPGLTRMAIRTRTKANFTLPNATLLRENPWGWTQLIVAVQLFLSGEVVVVDGIQSALLRLVVEGCLDARKLAKQILLMIGEHFYHRHRGRIGGDEVPTSTLNTATSRFAAKDSEKQFKLYLDRINPKALWLLDWIRKWIDKMLLQEAVYILLKWQRTILLNASLATTAPASPPDASPTTNDSSLLVAASYTEPFLLAMLTDIVPKAPTLDVSAYQVAQGREHAKTILDPANLPFRLDLTAPLPMGFYGVVALFLSDNLLDINRVYDLLTPSDVSLTCMANLVHIAHLTETNPDEGIRRRKQILTDIEDSPVVKTELSLYWSGVALDSQETAIIEEHVAIFESPKTQLLASLVALNLQPLAVSTLHRLRATGFPFERISYVRHARRCMFSCEFGEGKNLGWPSLLGPDFVENAKQFFSLIGFWTHFSPACYQAICESIAARLEQNGRSAEPSPPGLLNYFVVDILLPALMRAPVAKDPPSNLAWGDRSDKESNVEFCSPALQLSDHLWALLRRHTEVSERYQLYGRFFLEKMRTPPLRHFSNADRFVVAKTLKKVTADDKASQGGEVSGGRDPSSGHQSLGSVSLGGVAPLAENAQLVNYFFRARDRDKEREKDKDRIRRDLSSTICRYAVHNPFETLDCLIHNVELFDTLVIKVLLEYLKSVTYLAGDVCLFLVVERQQNRELFRSGVWETYSPKPRRLKNVAFFIARFLRRFTWVSPKALITSVASRLLNEVGRPDFPHSTTGAFGDYVYLQELISWLGGCPPLTLSELSEEQHRALSAGPVLKNAVLANLDLRDEEVMPQFHQSKKGLRDCLMIPHLFRSIFFSLCKISFAISLEYEPVGSRTLSSQNQVRCNQEVVDGVDGCIAHLLDYLAPSVTLLTVHQTQEVQSQKSRAYSLLPPRLWPILFQHCTSAVAWHLIRWSAPPVIVHVTEQEGSKSTPTFIFGSRAPRATWEEFVNGFVIPELIQRTGEGFFGLSHVSLHCLLTFWQLSIGDICPPSLSTYEGSFNKFSAEIRRCEQHNKRSFGENSPETTAENAPSKDLTQRARRMRDIRDSIQKEGSVKQTHVSMVLKCIEHHCGSWFTLDPPSPETSHEISPETSRPGLIKAMNELITRMIIHRAMSSSTDALYCKQYILLLIQVSPPGISLLVTSILIFSCVLPRALLGCTDREADNLVLFLTETLRTLQLMATSSRELVWWTDQGNRSSMLLGSKPLVQADIMRLLLVIERHVLDTFIIPSLAFLQEPESEEQMASRWFAIRRCLRFLNHSYQQFPVSAAVSHKIGDLLSNVITFASKEKSDWRDVLALAKSLNRRLSVVKRVPVSADLLISDVVSSQLLAGETFSSPELFSFQIIGKLIQEFQLRQGQPLPAYHVSPRAEDTPPPKSDSRNPETSIHKSLPPTRPPAADTTAEHRPAEHRPAEHRPTPTAQAPRIASRDLSPPTSTSRESLDRVNANESTDGAARKRRRLEPPPAVAAGPRPEAASRQTEPAARCSEILQAGPSMSATEDEETERRLKEETRLRWLAERNKSSQERPPPVVDRPDGFGAPSGGGNVFPAPHHHHHHHPGTRSESVSGGGVITSSTTAAPIAVQRMKNVESNRNREVEPRSSYPPPNGSSFTVDHFDLARTAGRTPAAVGWHEARSDSFLKRRRNEYHAVEGGASYSETGGGRGGGWSHDAPPRAVPLQLPPVDGQQQYNVQQRIPSTPTVANRAPTPQQVNASRLSREEVDGWSAAPYIVDSSAAGGGSSRGVYDSSAEPWGDSRQRPLARQILQRGVNPRRPPPETNRYHHHQTSP